jgi:hypothetical protein
MVMLTVASNRLGSRTTGELQEHVLVHCTTKLIRQILEVNCNPTLRPSGRGLFLAVMGLTLECRSRAAEHPWTPDRMRGIV